MKPRLGHRADRPVRLDVDGKCLDDTGNSSANGNKIQIWACNAERPSSWTYAEDGTLRIHGKCLDVAGAARTIKLSSRPAPAAANQRWAVLSTRSWPTR